jgi:hypothetical protein
MNRLGLVLVLSLCLPLAARADEASHRAKAEQLLAIVHTDRMVDQVSDSIKKQVSEAADHVAGPDAPSESKAKAADFVKTMSQTVDAQIGWKVMEPAFADLYMKAFTEEQLDAIVAFYKTPAGAAFMEQTPIINAQASQLLQAKMASLQPQMKQAYLDLQKSATPAAAAPPPVAPAAVPAAAPKAAPITGTPK